MTVLGLPVQTVAAAALLVLLLLASVALLVSERRAARMASRLAEVSRASRPAEAARALPSIRVASRDPRSLAARLAGLVAFDPARPEEHPAPWPLVLLFALAVGVLAGLLARLLAGPAAAVIAGGAAGVLAARAAFALGRSRYRDRVFAQLPDAMGMIVRALRAGIPVNEAVRTIAREAPEPTRREFVQVAAEQAIGVPLETSLLNLHARTGLREYGYFAVTIALQQQTGGSLTETLDNLADVVRRRVQVAARGRALAGQARMSALILATIPFVALAALSVLNPGYIAFYVTHEKGPQIAALAFTLLGFGVLTMQLMIRRSLAVR